MQETEITYYVYILADPRKNDQPFYVGKGTGRRAITHLWEIPETRNMHKENKITAIRAAGLEPKIIYVAENIIDEDIAYELEASLIKKYGRKGYNKGGILTNICEDSRPPNHKGKSYEEIYGSKEKADQQRAFRSMLQKSRGGYGPKIHSKETREKISAKGKGRILGSCPDERKSKIGAANSKYKGAANKKSYRWILTDPTGMDHITIGNLDEFCRSLGLALATMHKMLYHPEYRPRSGPAVGWKIRSENVHHTGA